MFDVEEVQGSSSSMIGMFSSAFSACKQAGLIVGVTTSHSAPYQCDTPADAVAFIKAWLQDPYVDVISPQLYSGGSEQQPEFAETNFCKAQGCTWDLYKNARPAIVPSIVTASQYSAVQTYFQSNYGIATSGFFQWAQTGLTLV